MESCKKSPIIRPRSTTNIETDVDRPTCMNTETKSFIKTETEVDLEVRPIKKGNNVAFIKTEVVDDFISENQRRIKENSLSYNVTGSVTEDSDQIGEKGGSEMLKDVKRKYSNEYAETRERITEKVIYPPVPGMGQVLNTGIYQSNECDESDENTTQPEGQDKMQQRKIYSCEECGKVCYHLSHFVRHKKTHTGDKPYNCEECGKTFLDLHYLKKHQILHSGVKSFVCKICDKAFAWERSLKEHAKIHIGDKPYECDHCAKSFGRRSSLRRHLETHNRTEFFVCSECNQTFITLKLLDLHIKREHIKKETYTCGYCGKEFRHKSKCEKHATVHTGEKHHKCDVCGKEFRQKDTLRQHLIVHTGLKPKECDECGRRFADKSSLRRHLMMHTGNKPHRCSYCGKTFIEKFYLSKHIRIHTKEKPQR